MGGRAKYKKNQKVLVPHTDKNYCARILQAQKQPDGSYSYRLHYEGWSNKYDEWVEEEGLLKYDPALLPPEDGGTGPPAATASGEADEEDAGGAEQPGDSGGGATAGPTGPGASRADAGEKAPKKRKAEVAALDAPLPDTTLPPQLRLHLPPLLKKVVLDDHDQVAHQYRVQPLPRRPCVADILHAFEASKAGEGGGADPATVEVVSGLLSYFDQGLRQLLLYQQEVQQHDEAVPRSKAASEVYGGEHLVRLLVKLPELVPVATMGPQNVVTLEGRLHELMAMLVEKQGQYFLPSGAYVSNPHVDPPPLPLPPLPAPAAAAGEQLGTVQ